MLDLSYDPPTDQLESRAMIVTRATQSMSSFDLDLQGLEVRSISVNGRPATWSREGAELTVTPAGCLDQGRRFVTVVTYDGVPETLEDGFFDSVIVHELTHQWFGDSLALEAWQHIWLNEGFASYAEWLWSEREGLGTAQEIFESFSQIPADDPFWDLAIGDPGPENLFDGAVYVRGAMTLHALRLEVGDRDFFAILRLWARSQSQGNVTTDEFIALAERVSGQELDDLFAVWLFTPAKPPGLPEPPPAAGASVQAAPGARALSKSGAERR